VYDADRLVRARPGRNLHDGNLRIASHRIAAQRIAAQRDEAMAQARESFEWYPKTGARQIATLTDWMTERKQELGTYAYAAHMKSHDDQGLLDLISLEYLMDANACVLGTPDECIAACRQYEEAGVDLLLCLVNPDNISHESVMQTIADGNEGHSGVPHLIRIRG
jgi:alkanesulfonate monooxygenase SsuD/methylene tetrahydromethanopterin reductase-like flavin-dependent oxidoreductase (luciferase family)